MGDFIPLLMIVMGILGSLAAIGFSIYSSTKRRRPKGKGESELTTVERPSLTAEQWAKKIVFFLFLILIGGLLIAGAYLVSQNPDTPLSILFIIAVIIGVAALRFARIGRVVRYFDDDRRR